MLRIKKELNMRQCRGWNFQKIKIATSSITPKKANKVIDALSRKSSIALMVIQGWILLEGTRDSVFKFEVGHLLSLMATLKIESKYI